MVVCQVVETRLQGVPKPSFGTNLPMPIFCSSPRVKLRFIHPVEKVRPFNFTCVMAYSNDL